MIRVSSWFMIESEYIMLQHYRQLTETVKEDLKKYSHHLNVKTLARYDGVMWCTNPLALKEVVPGSASFFILLGKLVA